MSQTGLWIAFIACISIFLAIDLGLFQRNPRAISIKESLAWTATWITLALLFNFGIYYFRGIKPATEFLTGYIIELSLSIDNVFIFVLIFRHFVVPSPYQHKVLLYGIISALIMRGIFIYLGTTLISQYQWIIYIFGAFLVFTGIKMLLLRNEKPDLNNNKLLRFLKAHCRTTTEYYNNHFWVRLSNTNEFSNSNKSTATIETNTKSTEYPNQHSPQNRATKNKKNSSTQVWFTPLFLVLILIEVSDLIFAVDSIPAVLAITQNPFIVYTSNIFAVLGLRSLYFVLTNLIDRFHYLKPGLAILLTFIGCKMLLSHSYPIPTLVALIVTLGILIAAIGASLFKHININDR